MKVHIVRYYDDGSIGAYKSIEKARSALLGEYVKSVDECFDRYDDYKRLARELLDTLNEFDKFDWIEDFGEIQSVELIEE